MKHSEQWYSHRLDTEMRVVRWGHYGVPLLLFPTAGGDPEEVERFQLIERLQPFIQEGRLKVYSLDSLNGRTWLDHPSVAHRVWIHQQFDQYLRHEAVPWIYHDCQSGEVPILTAGASIGAFNALNSICRHPGIFCTAICMSGTFDIQRWLEGQWYDAFFYHSPLQFLPGLSGPQLQQLQRSRVILATGQGRYENPGESWNVAHLLGQKGVPNRVDLWGPQWDHEWDTWRAMLPHYVQEALQSLGQ